MNCTDIRSIKEYLIYRVLGQRLFFSPEIYLQMNCIDTRSIKEYLLYRVLGQRLYFFSRILKYTYWTVLNLDKVSVWIMIRIRLLTLTKIRIRLLDLKTGILIYFWLLIQLGIFQYTRYKIYNSKPFCRWSGFGL